MSFTDEDYLPAPADLDAPQEIEITSAPLRAAAHQMGKYCDEQCKEFMLCRYEEQDARYCLKEGKAVTACGVEFLTKIKKTCYDSFTNYWQCLDYKVNDTRLRLGILEKGNKRGGRREIKGRRKRMRIEKDTFVFVCA